MYGSAVRPDGAPSVYFSSLKKMSPMARDTERDSTCGLIFGWPRRPRQTRPPTCAMRSASAGLLLRWWTSVSVWKEASPFSWRVPRITSLSPTLPTMQRRAARSTRATAAVVPSISSSCRARPSHSSSVRAKARRRASTGSALRAFSPSAASSVQSRSPQNSAARAPPCPSKIEKKEKLPSSGASEASREEGLDPDGVQPSTPSTALCASSISLRMFWIEWTPKVTGLPMVALGETVVVSVQRPERSPRE
mmetsp:Transcript_89868/g.232070  ORF Transcript_89868/g.232070 Transcript_89868/m.232070 type:complete len:250 (+) Transcript_89868:165-914(+)